MHLKRTAPKLALVAALAPWAMTAPAAAQTVLWMNQYGSPMNDRCYGMAIDNADNIYISGDTKGDFGGHSFGDYDAFLIKYDASGAVLWRRQPGTSTNDQGLGVAVAGNGDVYVTGQTWGSLGGTNAGNADIFLIKYDASGTMVWTRQLGTSERDVGNDVAVDKAGNVYLVGYTDGDLAGPKPRYSDAFLAKYDASGNQLWIHQFGTSGIERGYRLAVDDAQNVYMTGWTTGNLSAPPAGSWDSFLAKYDASGNVLWMRQFGTSGNDHIYGIAVDHEENVLVTGETQGPLAGTFLGGNVDAFLIKYQGDGTRLWSRQFGTAANDWSVGVATDNGGSAYVVGKTQGSFAGPLVGTNDVIVAKFDTAGVMLWADQQGTSVDDYGEGVVVDRIGNAYVASFSWGSLGGPSVGGADVVLAKYARDCDADCDQSTGVGVLDVFDFLCFQNSFVVGEPYACDCDVSTGPATCDIFDFLCFQNAFVAGCL